MGKGMKTHSANYWRKRLYQAMKDLQTTKKLCQKMLPFSGQEVFVRLSSVYLRKIEECQQELAKRATPLSM